MSIPSAVAASTLTPGIYITVDLLAGTASPGTGTLSVALIATQSASGDLTDDTEVRAIGGEADAATAFGSGTIGHLAAKQIYNKYGEAQIDVIKFLGKLGDEDSVKVFRKVLEDKNERLRVEGLLSLGKIGGTEAKEILRETARRGSFFRRNYEIQKAAVQALGGMGDEVAMPILGSILRSRFSLHPKKNNELRLQAAIALRKIATDEAMDFLRKTCSDKNSEIRNFSIAAIKTFDRGPEG